MALIAPFHKYNSAQFSVDMDFSLGCKCLSHKLDYLSLKFYWDKFKQTKVQLTAYVIRYYPILS